MSEDRKFATVAATVAAIYLIGAWTAYGHSWREYRVCAANAEASRIETYGKCGVNTAGLDSMFWPVYWFGVSSQWAWS